MDKNQNDFAARLQRIQEKAPVEPVTEAPEPRKRPVTHGVNKVMIYSTLAVLFIAAAGFGGLMLALPDEEARTSRKVAAAKAEEKRKVQTVSADASVFKVSKDQSTLKRDQSRRFLSDQGWRLWPNEVATADHSALNMAALTTGYDPNHRGEVGEVSVFEPNKECTLRAPRAGEVIRNVRLGYATGPGTLHSFTNGEMAEALLDHLSGQQKNRKNYKVGSTASGRMQKVDVFVTDTSAPVYLVLQTMGGSTLWNVQTAPGVELAHIAMIGQNTALIDPPGGTSFEGLRIGDFVDSYEFGANDEIRPCMIAPYRLPKEHWKGVGRARAGNELFVNQMYSFNTGHIAFNAWYTKVLGVDAETNVTEAHNAAHVLTGPMPAEPLAYQRVDGRKVHVMVNQHVLTSDAAVKEAHAALLIAAAGGDIALMDPAPRKRASE